MGYCYGCGMNQIHAVLDSGPLWTSLGRDSRGGDGAWWSGAKGVSRKIKVQVGPKHGLFAVDHPNCHRMRRFDVDVRRTRADMIPYCHKSVAK